MGTENHPSDIVAGIEAETVEIPFPRLLERGSHELEPADIRFVLPHRDLMMAVQKVVITPQKVIGVLEVSAARCIGCGFVPTEELILWWPIIPEMAAQTLGLWASQFEELLKRRKRCRLLVGGETRVHKEIRLGETVSMEINVADIKVRGRGDLLERYIRGQNFAAKVGGEVRATVDQVILKV